MLSALLVALVVQAAPPPRVTVTRTDTALTVTVRRAAVDTLVVVSGRGACDEPATLTPRTFHRRRSRGAEVVSATFDRPRIDTFRIVLTLTDGTTQQFDRTGARLDHHAAPPVTPATALPGTHRRCGDAGARYPQGSR